MGFPLRPHREAFRGPALPGSQSPELTSKDPKDGASYGLKSCASVRAHGHLRQSGTDQIRAGLGANEIALSFQVCYKTMGGALVNPGCIANTFETETNRGTLQSLENKQNLRNYAY
jgi:hypothetical protein